MGRFCEGFLGQTLSVGGFLSGCRDRDDLTAITVAWDNIVKDMNRPELATAPEQPRFREDVAGFVTWRLKMAQGSWLTGSNEFTMVADEIAEFDYWAGRAKSWRDWYERATGQEPTGDDPTAPGSPTGSGSNIGGVLDKATTLVLVAGGIWLAASLLRK